MISYMIQRYLDMVDEWISANYDDDSLSSESSKRTSGALK